MEPTTQAAAAIERYHARVGRGFIAKFRAPPSAVVQRGEDGAKYPRFIRFADGSSARVDKDGDVNEF